MTRSELGLQFERDFFGRSLWENFCFDIPFGSWQYEEALRDVVVRNRAGYFGHRKGSPQDVLQKLIRRHTTRAVRIYCAIHTVLDRDYGVDGFVHSRDRSGNHVVTFDLVLQGSARQMVAQKANMRIEQADLVAGRIENISAVIARRLHWSTTIVSEQIFAR